MQKVRMIGRQYLNRGGLSIRPGRRFAVSPRLAVLLEAVKAAARVVDSPTVRKVRRSQFNLTMPLDHDGDGRPGGSRAAEPTPDLADVRAEYLRVVGKRPFAGWDAAALRAKIAAHKADD